MEDSIELAHAKFKELREEQIGVYTDSILRYFPKSDRWGLASCIYVEWKSQIYALSCNHILKDEPQCFSGAKRITGIIRGKQDANEVGPLNVVASEPDPDLDLVLFSINGFDIATVPKKAYKLIENRIQFSGSVRDGLMGCLSFIYGLPGFTAGILDYPDDHIHIQAPLYNASGPIKDVSEKTIIGDFAEKECRELVENFHPS